MLYTSELPDKSLIPTVLGPEQCYSGATPTVPAPSRPLSCKIPGTSNYSSLACFQDSVPNMDYDVIIQRIIKFLLKSSIYQELRDTIRAERSVYNDFELQINKSKEELVTTRKTQNPPQHKYDLREYISSADERNLLDPVKNDSYIPLQPSNLHDLNKQAVQHLKPYSSIYLLVKSGETWTFPLKVVENEGSLDAAGVAAVANHPLNEDLEMEIESRLPISVHVNKYSKRAQESTQFSGVKTFFLKGRYKVGNLKGKEFVWCAKEELGDYLEEEVLKCVEPCLS